MRITKFYRLHLLPNKAIDIGISRKGAYLYPNYGIFIWDMPTEDQADTPYTSLNHINSWTDWGINAGLVIYGLFKKRILI